MHQSSTHDPSFDPAPLTAFVLAGGGSFGAAQAGMLLALAEAGIVPDLIFGTSVGALNGAFFAEGGDVEAAVRLREIWFRLRRRDVFPVQLRPLMAGITRRRDGVFSAERLITFINTNLPYRVLEDAPIPMFAMATDLGTGSAIAISSGDAGVALAASAAIPGVFPPVEIDGRFLADGSIAADLAISAALERGATTIYALPTASNGDGPPRGPLAVVQRATDLFIQYGTRQELSAGDGVVHLLPTPVTDVSSFNFSESRTLFNDGHDLAADWLQDRQPAAQR